MNVRIEPDGTLVTVYNETIDLDGIGAAKVSRASHVEPTPDGQWTADLGPVGGPVLGPFDLRSQALTAEVAWLEDWLAR